jgi:hypothetical protein
MPTSKGRADLADTRFVEAAVEEQRMLGALAPSLATGQALIGLLKGKMGIEGE